MPEPAGGKVQRSSNSIIGLVVLCLIIAALAAFQGQSSDSDQEPPIINPGPDQGPISNNPVSTDPSGGMGMVYILIAGLAIALIFTALRHNRSTPLRLAKARARFGAARR